MSVIQFRSYSPNLKRILVDTNIMINYADKSHKLNKSVSNPIRTYMNQGVEFFYPDFCLREFREYFRKLFLKTYLVNYITKKSLGSEVDSIINDIASGKNIRDRDFKTIRDLLEEKNPGCGLKVWYELCKSAIVGNLNDIEKYIEINKFKIANLNNLNLYSSKVQSNLPTIYTEAKYSGEFGLGTVDAALLDWFEKSDGLDGLLTNDGDLLMAHTSGAAPNGTLFTTLYGY